MSTSVVDAQQELEQLYPGYIVQLSLTERGLAVVEALGSRWIKAGLDPLLVDDPTRRLEVVLGVNGNEPMHGGGWIQPGTAGGMYLDGNAVGRVSLSPRDSEAVDVVKRVLMMPSLELLAGENTVTFGSRHGRLRTTLSKGYGAIYSRAPLALDIWKQARNSRGTSRARDARARMGTLSSAGQLDEVERTAWFALHWLEPGGAEVWALDSARIAKEAGYRVVITVDQPAPQRWLSKALEITDDIYLASNVLAEDDWGRFLRGLLKRYRPSLVMIHHSGRAYGYLPELRHLSPNTTVVDSTHVVEHRTGGFVRPSIEYSALIDKHHVISPELRDLYLLEAGVASAKVRYHPLTSRTTERTADAAARVPGPLRIGLLGRISPQKRPFLFIELARRLHAKNPEGFSFLVQGSGPLDGHLTTQIARAGLTGVVRRRAWGPPAEFFAEVDVLVVCSDNEGLTLTSLEADQSNVLVMSADVGSQATVVPSSALLPRPPRAFLASAEAELRRLAGSPEAFAQALADQHELVEALNEHTSAAEFFRDYITKLSGANS